jgi:hypothetical protein
MNIRVNNNFCGWDLRVSCWPRENYIPWRKFTNYFILSFKTKTFGDQKPPKMGRDDPKWIHISSI